MTIWRPCSVFTSDVIRDHEPHRVSMPRRVSSTADESADDTATLQSFTREHGHGCRCQRQAAIYEMAGIAKSRGSPTWLGVPAVNDSSTSSVTPSHIPHNNWRHCRLQRRCSICRWSLTLRPHHRDTSPAFTGCVRLSAFNSSYMAILTFRSLRGLAPQYLMDDLSLCRRHVSSVDFDLRRHIDCR